MKLNILHCHTDYYGPQLIGAYSSMDKLNAAVEQYAKEKPVWTKDSDDDLTFTTSPNWVSFCVYEIELDEPVKEIK